MTTIYSYTNAQREDEADNIKALILFDLEKQGLIEKKLQKNIAKQQQYFSEINHFFVH